MKTLIKRARPTTGDQAAPSIDLLIENGIITHIGQQLSAPASLDVVVDAADRYFVIPGLIDCSFHLPRYGLKSKTDVLTELHAAAASGVSTVCCMLDSHVDLEHPPVRPQVEHHPTIKKTSKVLAIGQLNVDKDGQQVVNELARLIDDGCVAFSNGHCAFTNTRMLKHSLEYAADFDCPLLLQPLEDIWLKHGCVHDAQVATRLGLPGIPRCAETALVAQYLEVARELDVAIHIGRISCARSVEMIARAKQEQLRVSADVAISHLFFSEHDTADFNTNMHMIPPLRGLQDREALLAGVADGTIDIICSDHQAHTTHSKLAPFPSSAAGASTVEMLLPMVLQLLDSGRLPAARVLAAVTSNPARLLKLSSGCLQPGAAADLCLFDKNKLWTVSADALRSRGKNCPFLDSQCHGRARCSFVDGEMIDNSEDA